MNPDCTVDYLFATEEQKEQNSRGVGEKFDSNDFVKSGGVMGEEV